MIPGQPPPIAGIEKYPDLQHRYHFEFARASGSGCCGNSAHNAVVRKFVELVAMRESSISKTSQNTRPPWHPGNF